MRRASWMSLGMIVTRLAWIAQRFVSSKRPTRYASAASWSARTAEPWKRRSVLKSCAIYAKRVTIMPKDIQLARRIRGERA